MNIDMDKEIMETNDGSEVEKTEKEINGGTEEDAELKESSFASEEDEELILYSSDDEENVSTSNVVIEQESKDKEASTGIETGTGDTNNQEQMDDNSEENVTAAETEGDAEQTTIIVSESAVPIKKRKKSKVKTMIAVCVLLVVAVGLFFLTKQYIVPAVTYMTANKAFENEDYLTARQRYEKLGDYKDAQEKMTLSINGIHYQTAEAAFNEGNFSQAIDEFSLAKGFKDSDQRLKESHYENGKDLFSKGDYVRAANEFDKSGDYSDRKDKINECGMKLLANKKYDQAKSLFDMINQTNYSSYCEGMIYYSSNDYDNAAKAFSKAGGVENASEMNNASKLALAKKYMDDGYLNTTKDILDEIPEGFTYGGVSSSDMLTLLNNHKDFLAFCGEWKAKSMSASVRQTHDSTGLWDQWDGDGWGYLLDIKCYINEDGTVTMKAKANFWMYTNYSSLSRLLKSSDWSATFDYTGKTVPSSLSINIDSAPFTGNKITGSLTLSKSNMKLNYQIVDKNSSMNFTYTFKAYGTYDSFVKAF